MWQKGFSITYGLFFEKWYNLFILSDGVMKILNYEVLGTCNTIMITL